MDYLFFRMCHKLDQFIKLFIMSAMYVYVYSFFFQDSGGKKLIHLIVSKELSGIYNQNYKYKWSLNKVPQQYHAGFSTELSNW